MIIGNYSDIADSDRNISLSLLQADMRKNWHRCSSTADYGADYISAPMPAREKVRNSISMVLNELVENAVKYTPDQGESIEIRVIMEKNKVLFQVDNQIDEKSFKAFSRFAKVLVKDGKKLYLEALKKTAAAAGGKSAKSQIGLLTILDFFHLSFGFQFEQYKRRGRYRVSVQTVMPLTAGRGD